MITQTQVLLIHWPKLQHSRIHLCLTQLDAKNTICFISFFFAPSNHFHNVHFGESPASFWSCRLSAIPPGCCWARRWGLGPFLMEMEEPPRRSGWGRKPHSVEAQEAGSDIRELRKTMAPPHTSAKPKIPVLFFWGREEMRGSSLALEATTIASNRETMRD